MLGPTARPYRQSQRYTNACVQNSMNQFVVLFVILLSSRQFLLNYQPQHIRLIASLTLSQSICCASNTMPCNNSWPPIGSRTAPTSKRTCWRTCWSATFVRRPTPTSSKCCAWSHRCSDSRKRTRSASVWRWPVRNRANSWAGSLRYGMPHWWWATRRRRRRRAVRVSARTNAAQCCCPAFYKYWHSTQIRTTRRASRRRSSGSSRTNRNRNRPAPLYRCWTSFQRRRPQRPQRRQLRLEQHPLRQQQSHRQPRQPPSSLLAAVRWPYSRLSSTMAVWCSNRLRRHAIRAPYWRIFWVIPDIRWAKVRRWEVKRGLEWILSGIMSGIIWWASDGDGGALGAMLNVHL